MSEYASIIPYRKGEKDAGKEFIRQDKAFSRWFFAEIAKPLLTGSKGRGDLRGCFVTGGMTGYQIEYMNNHVVYALFPATGPVRQLVVLGAGFGGVSDAVKQEMQARLEDYVR